MQDKTAEHCDWMDDGGFIQYYRAVGGSDSRAVQYKKISSESNVGKAGGRACEEAVHVARRSPQAELET